MTTKKKTSKGTWLFVAVIIAVSIASSAYTQYQRDQAKSEILEKYPTE